MTLQLTEHVYWVGGGICGISQEKDCHVYLIKSKEEAALVDTGCGIDITKLCQNILDAGTSLDQIKYVFLTHAHADHSGGAYYLRKRCAFKLVASELEKQLVEKGSDWDLGIVLAKKSNVYPPDYCFHHAKVDVVAQDNRLFAVGDLTIRTILVPGHSPQGVCLFMKTPEGNTLFSGDTVFLKGLISVINSPGSNIDAYRENLGKLANLQVDQLFTGHDLWTLANGQRHIDRALENLTFVNLPPMKI